MILEGLVTTLDADGTPHLAPMGPDVAGPGFTAFVLKPFVTSHTFRNLRRDRAGVLNVTDDVLLLAKAAVNAAGDFAVHHVWTEIEGVHLADACTAFEFRVDAVDDLRERAVLQCRVVKRHELRPFFGFNRAKHAVLEAAILATRTAILPRAEIDADMKRLAVIVDKTAGPREKAAFQFLVGHLQQVQDASGGS